MSAIVTVTFNPAIDKSTTVPLLISEKKLYCSQPVYEPGGGGINVARAIKKLGEESIAVYLAGGYTGKKLTQMLTDEGVESIVTETTESTRENLVVLEEMSNKQYRFGMPGSVVSEQEWQACLSSIEAIPDVKYIVASGSLPPGVPSDIFAGMAYIARNKNAKLIVDTSGDALKQAVKSGVYLIKPSIKELASLVAKAELSVESVSDVAREVIARGGCEVVVVSMGALGALLVMKEHELRITPPNIIVKSTVGAGDCMVAGIVLSLSKNKSLMEALQYGVACGTAATMNPGTKLCDKDDVEKLYNIIRQETELLSL